ncbi:hypothetical protein GCM10027418_30200 [Mariniluteicoccus endophyticus]
MSFAPMVAYAVAALVALVAFALVVRRRRTRATLRRLAMAVLLLLIAVRPVVGSQSGTAMAADLDVLLVIDRSTSMAAEDYNGDQPRTRGVAADVRAVTERYAGARFAMVTFTREGFVEMPFATDATAVVTLGDSISPQLYLYSAGSTISGGVESAKALLERAERDRPGRKRILVYMGDGEQTSADPPGSFAGLKPLVDGAVVMGYGTDAGGRMANGISNDHVRDRSTGDPAISRIDEGNLRRIAQELDGTYLHRARPDRPDLPGVRTGFSAALTGAKVTSGAETYWVFALGLLGLALWELWERATQHRRLRAELGVRTETTRRTS